MLSISRETINRQKAVNTLALNTENSAGTHLPVAAAHMEVGQAIWSVIRKESLVKLTDRYRKLRGGHFSLEHRSVVRRQRTEDEDRQKKHSS